MNKKNYKILNVVHIEDKQYAIVDAGPAYVNGLFAKYIIVPMSSLDMPCDNDVRIYDENA